MSIKNRDQLACVAAFGRFVAHPGGADGILRPKDDYGLRALHRAFDFAVVFRAAMNVTVPPYRMAMGFERCGDRGGTDRILVIIAQKHAGHEPPSPFGGMVPASGAGGKWRCNPHLVFEVARRRGRR